MKDKDAYIQKLHARLDEWKADIERLRARSGKIETESRLEYEKHIKNLTNKHREAEQSVSKVREAGDDVREDLKSSLQSAWDALEEAIKSARSRFK